jgi:hypothetical protein
MRSVSQVVVAQSLLHAPWLTDGCLDGFLTISPVTGDEELPPPGEREVGKTPGFSRHAG